VGGQVTATNRERSGDAPNAETTGTARAYCTERVRHPGSIAARGTPTPDYPGRGAIEDRRPGVLEEEG